MEQAGYVVVGAGAFGASTAYHLTRRGAQGVVLLDRYDVGSQTSPRAAGLFRKVAGTELGARLMDEATEQLAAFDAESGGALNFHRNGSLLAALTPDGEERLRRDAERATELGIHCELVSHAEAARLAPFFDPGRARAILYSPQDAWLDPDRLAPALAARAAEGGASVRPNTPVTGVLHEAGRVLGVRTAQGEIRAPVVVDAAGAWAKLVAEVAGIYVPMLPTRHQLYTTEPLPGLEPLQPTVRILEPSVYVRYDKGGLMVGGYEDTPRQVDPTSLPPDFQIPDLELDLGVLHGLTDEVLEFFPPLRDAPVREHRGGLPTVTPDGYHIVGPVPNLEGFYIISGCNVGGLSISPALGRALADLILDGHCQPDLRLYSIERFADTYHDPAELAAACQYAYARKYVK
jgi:4-methylaminobutanoate oxidase (formaldehyde-forming)